MKTILILTIILTSSCFGYFREDVTLLIPSEYPTIQAALNELDEKAISREVTVTLKIADGTYHLNESLLIKHPYASQIQIIGNQSTPSSCTLIFDNAVDGISISDGTSLLLIDGITVKGTGNYGILVNRSSSVTIGDNVVVHDFSHGIFAANNSHIDCSKVSVINASSVGITATSGSHVTATEASINGCSKGVSSNMNSSIQCDSSNISNCMIACHSANGSYVHALNISLIDNTQNYSPSADATGNWQSYIRTQ